MPPRFPVMATRRCEPGTRSDPVAASASIEPLPHLRPAAQEVQELRLQARIGGWCQPGAEDVGLADPGVHRLEDLVREANRVLVEVFVCTDRSGQVPRMVAEYGSGDY